WQQPELLAKNNLLDAPGLGPGNRMGCETVNRLRPFERRHRAVAESAGLREGERAARRLGNQRQNHRLSQNVVRLRQGYGLVHIRVLHDAGLALEAGDILPAAADDRFQPVNEENAIVLVAIGEIAGMEPAVANGLVKRRLVVEITGETLPEPGHDLADLA